MDNDARDASSSMVLIRPKLKFRALTRGPDNTAIIGMAKNDLKLEVYLDVSDSTFRDGSNAMLTLSGADDHPLYLSVAGDERLHWSHREEDASQYFRVVATSKDSKGKHFSMGNEVCVMYVCEKDKKLLCQAHNSDEPYKELRLLRQPSEHDASPLKFEIVTISDTLLQANAAEVQEASDEDYPLERIDTPPPGSKLITLSFAEGPLGITLRRRQDGVIYVHEVIPHSQADGKDIESKDELWSAGTLFIQGNAVEKEEWIAMVEYIKHCERPLRIVLRRRLTNETEEVKPKTNVNVNAKMKSLFNRIKETNMVKKIGAMKERQQMKQRSDSVASESPPDTIEMSLELIAAKAVFPKEKADKNAKAAKPIDISSMVLKEGRQLLMYGTVNMLSKASIWNMQNKKCLFLCTDCLMITTPLADKLQLDAVCDLQTCKVSRHVTDIIDFTVAHDLIFELFTPAGVFQIVTSTSAEKQDWINAIFGAICECVGESERVLGWRHQYLLGTMHSAVISRDVTRVKGLLIDCQEGRIEYDDIEKADEDGYTPLHYACMLRLLPIVKCLNESSSDITMPDNKGLTSFHWACLQLDYEVLEVLCTRVFDVDLLDNSHRTPLFVACVEGRDVSGRTNIFALKKCISILLESGANVNVTDSNGCSLLHYLGASWQYEISDMLIKAGADINHIDNNNGWSVLHHVCACEPLKAAIGEGARIISSINGTVINEEEAEEVEHANSIRQLQQLLTHGCNPHAKDLKGITSLQLVMNRFDKWGVLFQSAVIMLLGHGARWDDGDLPCSITGHDEATVAISEGLAEWTKKAVINGNEYKIKYVLCC